MLTGAMIQRKIIRDTSSWTGFLPVRFKSEQASSLLYETSRGQLNQPLFRQNRQPLHMLALIMRHEPHAFAGAIARGADAGVIERAQAQAMHREAAAADFAGDFLKDVVGVFFSGRDAKDARAVGAGGAQQANGSARFPRRFRHAMRVATTAA